MSRKDPDFGLKKSIEDIFDGAEMPDDVRAAIEEAEKLQRFSKPIMPNPQESESKPAPPIPLVQPNPPKTLGSKQPLRIEKPTPVEVELDPVDLEPDIPTVGEPPSPEVEDRELDSNVNDDEIEQLKSRFKCPKEFECCETGFTVLCKTRLKLGGRIVECVGKHQQQCRFRRSLLGMSICSCRMRQYIARKLGL